MGINKWEKTHFECFDNLTIAEGVKGYIVGAVTPLES
jgi:hypothetical protein